MHVYCGYNVHSIMFIENNLYVRLGMLSKSKGQVLRVAAVLHVLFVDPSTLPSIPSVISIEAINAAQNFVDTCCQHAAFIAGRGLVDDEIDHLVSGAYVMYCVCTT